MSPLAQALSLLARRHYHSLELIKKLKEKGLPADDLEPLIQRLKQDGYLDDLLWEERFVEGWIRKGRGVYLLGPTLYQKGLSKLLESLKAKVLEGEESAMREVLKKEKGDLKDPKIKRRTLERLMRRGFEAERAFAFVEEWINLL